MAFYDIDGSKFASEVRAQISGFLDKIASDNIGPTPPANPFQNMEWADTSGANTIAAKIYDGVQWLTLYTINTSTKEVTFPVVIPTVPNASTTEKGLIELATNEEAKAGVATLLALSPSRLRSMRATQAEAESGAKDDVWMTPLKVKQAIDSLSDGGVFTESFPTPPQTITSGGLLTIAHTLSSQPTMYMAYLVCVSADAGWAVDDEIPLSTEQTSAGITISRGVAVWPDATNLNIRFANTANVFTYLNKNTGGRETLANSKWKLIVRAYA